jgi:hypothetical protein
MGYAHALRFYVSPSVERLMVRHLRGRIENPIRFYVLLREPLNRGAATHPEGGQRFRVFTDRSASAPSWPVSRMPFGAVESLADILIKPGFSMT